MAEFLLELLSEEIPAGMQLQAAKGIGNAYWTTFDVEEVLLMK